MFKLTLENVNKNNKTTNIELKTTKCDIEQVVEIYNKMFDGLLPKVNILNKSRQRLVNARFKEFGYDGIRNVFDNIKQSDFLLGSTGWKSTKSN